MPSLQIQFFFDILFVLMSNEDIFKKMGVLEFMDVFPYVSLNWHQY